MQENESKRNRAVKRAGDERKQREQKEQEIVKLKKQCKERQDEETRLRRDLEEHRRYHDFLAQVWCGLVFVDRPFVLENMATTTRIFSEKGGEGVGARRPPHGPGDRRMHHEQASTYPLFFGGGCCCA